ncbi:NO-inducible flavohemoprotein [Komagataeibacter kakiaceti JCM 25156]|uniref:NO-inducible flavohemoprotein n=1 Tax=Komagataeibacter kakiaceti TaxID=943261 RepID=UPI000470FF35|nr:NO-inducible flavohemoprotein [Komagataeibacter kakiaceti]
MAAPLDDATRSIIKACVPVLEAHGVAITTEMYRRLLANPDIRDLFNMSHQKDGEQPRALALAVLAYARNIDNLGALGGMVERIAEKHAGLNILPEHYPFVAEALLGAIAHVLGDAATPEILDAWGKAYWFLADILIGREKEIYQAHEAAPGGWVGWRPFRVQRRVKESETVTSFELVPVDGRPVMRHVPGQYLSFRLDVPVHGSQRRNYSISSAPDDSAYRISVRRIPGGVVSEWLHDTVGEGAELQVSAPAGDFVLDRAATPAIMLLSAGVGLTPLMSMLDTLMEREDAPAIHYVHATRTPQTEAFGRHIRKLAASGRVRHDVFYSRETAPDTAAQTGTTQHAGRLSPEWLKAQARPDSVYYICGPDAFMREMVAVLRAAGVPDEAVRFEFFGSAADAELAA